jgi:hypothetical protein
LEAAQYLNDWFKIGIILVFITFVFLLFFYFFTKPNKTAVKRFWLSITIMFIVNIILVVVIILMSCRNYVEDAERLNRFILGLSTAAAAIVNTAIIFLMAFVLLMTLGQFKIHWNLRAMRRYPFKWIP